MEHEVIVLLSMEDFAMILRRIMIHDSKYINEKEQHENQKRLCVLSPWQFVRIDYLKKKKLF